MSLRMVVPVAALAVVSAGCGRGAAPGPAAVRGTVTFQGRPLAGGLVVLAPDPDRGGAGRPIRGDVGPDGRYELRPGGEAAVPPGWYRVALAPAAVPAAGPAFPPKLGRPDLSGLVREVKAGRENVFDFAVEVPPG
jgi:hypothetical protein